MLLLKRLFILIFLNLSLIGGLSAAEWHGYMRSGVGVSDGGSDQTCFKAKGAETGKARLGNECDTYIELGGAEEFKTEGSAVFKAVVNVSLVSDAHRDWESSAGTYDADSESVNQDFVLALREAYVSGSKLLGDEPTVWVGKRFYRRHDVHLLDFYYLADTGPGFGVEDIPLGFGKFHVALLRNIPAGKDGGPAQDNLDLRISNISVPGGELQPVFIYAQSYKKSSSGGANSYEELKGYQFGAIYSQDGFLGGGNHFVVQYGLGLFGGKSSWRSSLLNQHGGYGSQIVVKGDSDTKDAIEKSSSLRILDHGHFKFSNQLIGEYVLLWQSTDFGGAKDTDGSSMPNKEETVLGLRPIYLLNEHVGLAFEYGLTLVQNAFVDSTGDYKDSQLQKFTFAPQFMPSANYWARPQLRLFATYAVWNSDSKGEVGTTVYSDELQGWSSGAQVELWF